MSALVEQMTMMTSLLQTVANQQRILSQGTVQIKAVSDTTTMDCMQWEEEHPRDVCPWTQQPVYTVYDESWGNDHNHGWRDHLIFGLGENLAHEGHSFYQFSIKRIEAILRSSLPRIATQVILKVYNHATNYLHMIPLAVPRLWRRH